jgi:glutamyl-tRNA reductase
VTVPTGLVSGVSISHRKASLDHIERAAVESQHRGVEALLSQPGVREAFCLQTCNRVEAYVVTDEAEAGRAALDRYTTGLEGVRRELNHEASLEHLIRVGCGLESLVLGEDQILGQLRDAYERARGTGALGPILEESVTKAIHVGERARTETEINEGVVSIGSAAVKLADREHGLKDASALVLGAGEMGSLAARALADAPIDELLVANRTIPHAEHVAADVEADARALGLDGLPSAVETADVVVTATGSDEPLLDRPALADAGETFVIDIAQPRDVDPAAADLDDVTLHDMDSLEAVTERTRERRRDAAETVERLVDREFEHLLERFKRKRADDVIAAMYESAEYVKDRELRKAVEKLEAHGELTDDQREAVESLADALVGQLLAAPTRSLREAAAEDDWTTIDTALQLFDPEFGPDADRAEGAGPPEFVTGSVEDD